MDGRNGASRSYVVGGMGGDSMADVVSVCVCVCVCVVVGKARWMVSGGVGSARRGYSSVVEHSTADREVPGSIPGAPSLALVAPAVCESAARPRRASCRRGFASSR